jgi:hypothetical protein
MRSALADRLRWVVLGTGECLLKGHRLALAAGEAAHVPAGDRGPAGPTLYAWMMHSRRTGQERQTFKSPR